MTVSVASVLLLLTASLSVRKISGVSPLDMAENSVDDSYEGCRDAIKDLVDSKYITVENFKTDFPGNSKWEDARKNCANDGLDQFQCAAIFMYTLGQLKNSLYKKFNLATLDGKKAYLNDTFQFYTLHFFLTDAIQQLKKKKKDCVTTYRRSNARFDTDVRDKTIRFGSFASSSLRNNLEEFGVESCFQMKTCFGASVEKYSNFPREKEVLIPPYEVFKVKDIKKQNTIPRCNVVYELLSDHQRSNLKCSKANNGLSALEISLAVIIPLVVTSIIAGVIYYKKCR